MSGNPLKYLLSPLLTVTGVLGGKKPKPQIAPAVITPNPAADAMRNSDLLRQRRGIAANTYAGSGGEAATPGARALFGQGG